MSTLMFVIAGMMVILAILVLCENRNHPNFMGFVAVSMWFILLSIFTGYMGYLFTL